MRFCQSLDEARRKLAYQLWAYGSSARWYAGLRSVKLEMDTSVLTELQMG
jgi:hypothetical protein